MLEHVDGQHDDELLIAVEGLRVGDLVAAARKRAPDQLDHLVGQCDRFASVSFLTLPPSR